MRRLIVSASLIAALLGVAVPAPGQDTKSARGTVSAVAGDIVTVKAGSEELKFTVDAKTEVIASGAGTASRSAEAKGTSGPKLGELIKVGDAVEVSYRETAGMLHATTLRRVRSAGEGGGSTSDTRPQTATGTVTAVSASSLTISGTSGGNATFTQTFAIDGKTKVIGEGAGTASAKGKVMITDLVTKGNHVVVTYQPSGTELHATEVRVRRGPSNR
jgi:hypothetical protein